MPIFKIFQTYKKLVATPLFTSFVISQQIPKKREALRLSKLSDQIILNKNLKALIFWLNLTPLALIPQVFPG